MLAYDARGNPPRRRAPAHRPDFVVLPGPRSVATLDARYRDLWEQPLPGGMLYQLVMYATSRQAGGQAVILYPTSTPMAREACIEVRDPLVGGRRAEVILRPVDMLRLGRLVVSPGTALQERDAMAYARNLVLVALPLETAHRDARELARALGAEYVDFDCELLAQMEADDWDDHVTMERCGTLAIGQRLAKQWLVTVAARLNRARPLVVGNINLAVRYNIDVATALYDATEAGLCVIAAGGRLQGQTLLIHGLLSQTGAGSPAYEVIPPPVGGPQCEPPVAIQEWLL